MYEQNFWSLAAIQVNQCTEINKRMNLLLQIYALVEYFFQSFYLTPYSYYGVHRLLIRYETTRRW